MMTATGRRLAMEQLRQKGADVRLIFLHPNFADQHTVLSDLKADEAYVRLNGAHLIRETITEQIHEELELQSTRLGDVRTLYLDEADRAVTGDLIGCLHMLLEQMPTGRIVICSRTLPPELLTDPVLRKQTHFVPTSDGMMLLDYAQRDDNNGALLEVRALGSGRVEMNGQPVTQWDGILPRSLFFYLVDRGLATRNDIFATFWPTLPAHEATNVFHVTKRKVSEVLGMDLTVYWSGFYHISPRVQLSYDVSTFTQITQDSAILPVEDSVSLLEEAVTLYRGDFLTSLDTPWIINRRQDLLQTYEESLIGLAKIYERMDNIDKALGLYLRAFATNLLREDLAFSIMRLYRTKGLLRDALVVCERLEKELRRSLNVAPGRQVQELAEAIRNELNGRS
jgi:DNA-binding SARP family transcriptional activator